MAIAGNPPVGGVIIIGSHTIKTWSRQQKTIALSSAEAEFYSAGKLAAHLLFFCFIFREIKIALQGNIVGLTSPISV